MEPESVTEWIEERYIDRKDLVERLEDRYDHLTSILRETEGNESYKTVIRSRRREVGKTITIIEEEF